MLLRNIILLMITPVPVTLLSMEDTNQSLKDVRVTHLAILVSGRGSNMEAIIAKKIPGTKTCVVISNNSNALALSKAIHYGVPAIYIDGRKENNPEEGSYSRKLIDCLEKYAVTPANGLICLAGFMKILDARFIQHFKGRILNIHPSLLPAFPGRDAIGQALKYGVKITGCTVHFVDEGVDTGAIIKQASVEVAEDDTHETLEKKINMQEHRMFPEAIALFVQQKIIVEGGTARIIS